MSLNQLENCQMVSCPVCSGWVLKDQIGQHIKSCINKPIEKRLMERRQISCPICTGWVLDANLDKHLRRCSNKPVSEKIKRAVNRLASAEMKYTERRQIVCPICSNWVLEERLEEHLKKVHKATLTHLGSYVVEKLLLEGVCYTEYWESCSACKKRIIYLKIGDKTFKAFDVDRHKKILGAHICLSKSKSVYTYSAGMFESNRRRH